MRRNHGLWIFVALFSLTTVMGCSDEVEDTPWEFDDSTEQSVESLDGPPNAYHYFLGQVESRRYFWLGHRVDNTSIVVAYTPGEGWSIDEPLGNAMKGEYPYYNTGGDRIMAVDDDLFIINFQSSALYRSTDGGRSWQERSTLPIDSLDWHYFGTDGEALFVGHYSSDIAEKQIWVSRDNGDSWSILDLDEPLQTIITLPGLLVTRGSGWQQASRDGGQSWQEIDSSCTNLPAAHWWFTQAGESYFYSTANIEHFTVDSCSTIEVEGFGVNLDGSINRPNSYATVGGRVFGFGYTGWGLVEKGLTAWTDLSNPPNRVMGADDEHRFTYLVDLNEEGLALHTTDGLWRTDDDGQSWTPMSNYGSNPIGVAEHDGKLLTPESQGPRSSFYQRSVNGGDWESVEPLPADLRPTLFVQREGHLFGLSQGHPMVSLFNEDTSQFEKLWEIPSPYSISSRSGVARAGVEIVDGEIVVYSAGNQDSVVVPGHEPLDGPAGIPGGVYSADSINDGEFQPLGTGFPEDEQDVPLGVHDMAIADDQIWIVTDRRGVWTADLDSRIWRAAHDGLPTADDPMEDQEIFGLSAPKGSLYAYSADALFVRDDDQWRRLTTDSFTFDHDSIPQWPIGIADVVHFDGTLLVAAWDGLYEIDRSTGERNRVWRHDDRPINFAKVLRSGLYIGVRNGGLWRFTLE